MGYFYDNSLFHADKRDKGMNSTSNEKGTDGKKNNTSEYNHDYYMKNKDKWQDNKSTDDHKDNDTVKELSDMSGMKEEECQKLLQLAKTKGYDSPEYKELLNSLSEGDPEQYKRMEAVVKKNVGSSDSGEKEFDVDAAARDVIRGKYGNGAERKAALGDDYAEVQKRVNELMKAEKDRPTSREKNATEGSSKVSVDKNKKYVRHMEVAMTNNDWRFYQGDPDYLMHHGIRGQKWGVRRFQNADGTLTSAGRSRYGEGSDKVEKYSTKAVRRENKAINANNALSRGWNTALAVSARQKADKKASKAEGDYNMFALNKNISRANGASAEANANIAAGLKKRAEGESGKRKERLINQAVARLASAENGETFAKSYKAVSETNGFKKGSKAVKELLNRANNTYTKAGRKSTIKDKVAESIGDAVMSELLNRAASSRNEDAPRISVTGATGMARDAYYRSQNDAQKRWNKIMNGK